VAVASWVDRATEPRTVRRVPRLLAPAALIAVLVAAGFVVAATTGEDALPRQTEGKARGHFGGSAPAISPGLRTIADLALPGGPGQVDSGVGVYPRLTTAERLAFPGPAALDRARRFARAREGEVAFAVADDHGGISGLDVHRPFPSASLSKAMILVAYLRGLAAEDAEPSESDLLTLGYMIRLSDNASADIVYSRVGDEGLMRLARRAGMKGFAVSGDWANATVTPADQARFFLAIDRLVPRRFRELTRDLLETVSELQSWGIPVDARPRWRVFFKGGWRPEEDGEMVHQAALLEQGPRRVAIAVMTTAGPDMVYGERSIQGVGRALLTGAPAALTPVRSAGSETAAPAAQARRRVGSAASRP